ncbi:MAG: prepilin-type N-terminal cleavage/methylation domain-containing protein [Planctomycetes bacterium]|nr:prepilin-type N-terminal cleavage/methylation domain-containing protein [Planctomycetota bacterium]
MPHKNQNCSCRKALTLLEMIIALGIVSVLFAVVLPVFTTAGNSWKSRQASSEAIQNGRILVDYINSRLMKAVKIIGVSDPTETNGYIEYEDTAGTTLRFDIAANNYVQFGEVGSQSELAGPVTKLQFTCYGLNDLSTPITDTEKIRLVKVEAVLGNTSANGRDKTFKTSAFLAVNGSSGSGPVPEEPISTPPIGWWKFDDASGTTAVDSSGNGNDGTLNEMTGDEWTTGVDGGALAFDGIDDRVEGIGNCPTANFTVAAWAKDTNTIFDSNKWAVIYSAEQEIWLGVDRGEFPILWLDCGGNGKGANLAVGAWTHNVWHHIAATWDGTDIHIYLDGVDMLITVYGVPENPGAKAAAIGDYSKEKDKESWNGLIDDVRIFDYALTAGEIATLAGSSGGEILP